MSPELIHFLSIAGGIISFAIIFNVIKYFVGKRKIYKRFVELKDCPFPFSICDDVLEFDLDGTKLYCDYQFGIRKDGVYGIKELSLNGINNSWGRIELNIGQSILPFISKMEQFEKWVNTKTFDTFWKSSFAQSWKGTMNKLDNFKIIEYEDRKHKGKV
jgi:hypothetical protein